MNTKLEKEDEMNDLKSNFENVKQMLDQNDSLTNQMKVYEVQSMRLGEMIKIINLLT
jgi:hypothetical protein